MIIGVFILFFGVLQFEVAADTLLQNLEISPSDTLNAQPQVQQPEEELREFPAINPLEYSLIPGFQEVFTDSLMRWEQWFNLAERDNRRPGIITYRLGAHGRNDGILNRGIDIRHRQVYLEDFLMNDPVSGSQNSNLLPLDRMRLHTESTSGIQYQSVSYLNRYYVVQPLTLVHFEDTARDVRRAEAILTQNFNRSTNLELTYRGNNDNGDYSRNFLSGRQASVNLTQYMNENWVARAMLFYNSSQMGEPEGYNIPDRANFAFIPSNTQPVSTQSRSSLRQSLIAVSLFHRKSVDDPVSTTINLYNHRYRRFFYSPTDTSFHRAVSYGINATHMLTAGPFRVRPYVDASYSFLDEDQSVSLDFKDWQTIRSGVRAGAEISNIADITIWGNSAYRSDNFTTYDTGYRFNLNLGSTIQLHQSLSIGRVMPTIQQLYWQSNEINGNENLTSENITRIEAGASYQGRSFMAGIKGFMSTIENPVIINPETSLFVNGETYQSLGTEVYFGIDTEHIELELSSTIQKYLSDSEQALMMPYADDAFRFWNRASFYLKSYFFDFATFAKIGVSGVFSPNIYRTGNYYPRLDYWDPIAVNGQIPSFYRVDLEASARVRSIFFLLKYENILDNVGQFGYFETADYPMSGRRLRFGVRVLLRN